MSSISSSQAHTPNYSFGPTYYPDSSGPTLFGVPEDEEKERHEDGLPSKNASSATGTTALEHVISPLSRKSFQGFSSLTRPVESERGEQESKAEKATEVAESKKEDPLLDSIDYLYVICRDFGIIPFEKNSSKSKEEILAASPPILQEHLKSAYLGASRNDVQFQAFLGAAYLRGFCCETCRSLRTKAGLTSKINNKEAVRWLKFAADQNSAGAQYNLRNCYINGWGITKNATMANDLYRKSLSNALNKNEEDVVYAFAEEHYFGANLPKNKREAFSLLQQTIAIIEKKGNKEGHRAYILLGACYESGWGCTQDYKKAFEKFLKGEKDDKYGNFIVANYYAKGLGGEKDLPKAFGMMKILAEGSHLPAMFELSLFYEQGMGCEQDLLQSFELMKLVAESFPPDTDAMFELGRHYENGIGCTKDLVQASYWYDKAGAQFEKDQVNKLLKSKRCVIL